MSNTMRWRVKMGGREFCVETRDKHDWVDEHSDQTIRTGAFAEIPWRDPARSSFTVAESVVSTGSWNEAREVTHRSAIEKLAHDNDCTEEKDGEVVAVFSAEVIVG